MTNYVTKLDLGRQAELKVIDESDISGLLENDMTIIYKSTNNTLRTATKTNGVVATEGITDEINGKTIPEFPAQLPAVDEAYALGAVQYGLNDYELRWVLITGSTI